MTAPDSTAPDSTAPNPSAAQPVNTKTMHVTWLGEQRYLGVSGSGHQLLIDNSATKIGVSPMEALLGALATCTAYDVVEVMNKRRTPLSRYRIEVEGLRAQSDPKRYTTITLRHIAAGKGVSAEQFERAAKLSHEKYCSVAASLNSEIVVETQLEDLVEEATSAC